jgi:hypothetical protein
MPLLPLARAVALLLVATPLLSQGPPSTTAPAAPGRVWALTARLEARAEVDDNVFLLPPDQLARVGAPTPAEQRSGRYDLMASPSDVISTLRAGLRLTRPGLGGRELIIAPEATYEHYASNAERRNLLVSLLVEQDLRRGGRLRFRSEYLPSYYSRNYLVDAIDANGNGRISAAERVYARGDYGEFFAELDYRLRLKQSQRDRPLAAFLLLGLGYADQTYEAPFTARDARGPTGRVRVDLSPRRGLEFATSYEAALLGSPITRQVILVDEPAFGQDLNGDGDATDSDVRVEEAVDRSRLEHLLRQTVTLALGARTELEVEARVRLRRFASDQPFDVANNGRRDQRVQLGAALSRRIAPDLRLLAGVRYGTQRLNRRTDLGAEGAVDDYRRLQAHLGLRYTP